MPSDGPSGDLQYAATPNAASSNAATGPLASFASAPQQSQDGLTEPDAPALKAIGTVNVGERLSDAGVNPQLTVADRAAATEPDEATWRKLTLRLDGPDGHRVDIETLKPLAWIERHSAEPGSTIALEMRELGVSGRAEVLSIGRCEIAEGTGPVVISKFAHTIEQTVALHATGLDDPIKVTPNHPIWSEDRQEFVRVEELLEGERLRTRDGRECLVTTIIPRAGPKTVYNLEVGSEHVYLVGEGGVLVHNNKLATAGRRLRRLAGELWTDETGSVGRPGTVGPNRLAPKRPVFDGKRWHDPVTGRFLKKPVVIGESMERVEEAARRYNAETFQPSVWDFGSTNKAFKRNTQANAHWLNQAIDEGHPVIDIGLDPERLHKRGSRSIYYYMESEILNERSNDVIRILLH